MDIAEIKWDPLSITEVYELFSRFAIPWWISGGWALDLFIGQQTREHEDTDVLILRKDQLRVQKELKDWFLFRTKSPDLSLWRENEYLELPVNSIWVKKRLDLPFAFEMMLQDSQQDEWLYRRNPTIRGRINELGLVTKDGYLILNRKSNCFTNWGGSIGKRIMRIF